MTLGPGGLNESRQVFCLKRNSNKKSWTQFNSEVLNSLSFEELLFHDIKQILELIFTNLVAEKFTAFILSQFYILRFVSEGNKTFFVDGR